MRALKWAVIGATFHMTVALAEEPMTGPAIADYGPTFAVDDRDVPVEENLSLKVVFDAVDGSNDPSSPNSEVVSVARFLNMHARNGVSIENLDAAVVFHGGALVSALNDEAYKARYGIPNPNSELLLHLHDAGVQLYICGQSMGFRNVAKKDLAEPVKVALSAMTVLASLQAEGYALLP